jgi:hypothetical protein
MEIQAHLHGCQDIVEIVTVETLRNEGAGRVVAPRSPAEIARQEDAKGPVGIALQAIGLVLFSQVNLAETGTGNSRHTYPLSS